MKVREPRTCTKKYLIILSGASLFFFEKMRGIKDIMLTSSPTQARIQEEEERTRSVLVIKEKNIIRMVGLII